MDLLEFVDFYKTAKRKEMEEKVWGRWLSVYPLMTLGYIKHISFDEYMDKLTGKHIDRRSDAEIIKELEALHGKKLL